MGGGHTAGFSFHCLSGLIVCGFCTDTRVGLYFIVRSSAKREIKNK
jgi:hypothetical protein